MILGVFPCRAENVDSVAGYKDGIAKFAALGDKLVYTSSHDPAVEVREGSNDKAGIGVWGKCGRIKVCAGFDIRYLKDFICR